MAETYDFTGLTKAQEALLHNRGWVRKDWPDCSTGPRRETLLLLVGRGLLLTYRDASSRLMSCMVSDDVHRAWLKHCAERA